MPKVRDINFYIKKQIGEGRIVEISRDNDLIVNQSHKNIDDIVQEQKSILERRKQEELKFTEFVRISNEEEQYHFIVNHFDQLKEMLMLLLDSNIFHFIRTTFTDEKVKTVEADILYEKSLYFILTKMDEINHVILIKMSKLAKISKKFYKNIYYEFYQKISVGDFLYVIDQFKNDGLFSHDEIDQLITLRLQETSLSEIIEHIFLTKISLADYPNYRKLMISKMDVLFNQDEIKYHFKKELPEVLDIISERMKQENTYKIIFYKVFKPSYSSYRLEEIDRLLSNYPEFMEYIDQTMIYQLISKTSNLEKIKELKMIMMLIKKINLTNLLDYVKEEYLFSDYKKNAFIEKTVRDSYQYQEFNEINVKSMFDSSFLSLLNQFKNGKNLELYPAAFDKFKEELHSFIEFDETNPEDLDLIHLYFNRVIKGYSLFELIYFNDIFELNVNQRFGDLLIDPKMENVRFIKSVPTKQYLKLFRKYMPIFVKKTEDSIVMLVDFSDKKTIRFGTLLLHAMLIFEYEKLDVVLNDIGGDFGLLEELFDGIDLSKIKLDSNGKVIYNKKMENLFVNREYNVLNDCPFPLAIVSKEFDSKLTNTLLAKKYFTYIVNHWKTIEKYLGVKNISLPRIFKTLSSIMCIDNTYPRYPELNLYSSQIGESKLIIEALDQYYSLMKQRFYSSVPKVQGSLGNLSYEMLDLDDPLALIAGKLTNCCFRIDGEAKTAMYHSMISVHGRVFVVKEENEIVAQSWVWRRGNTICFDNIEFPRIYRKNLEFQKSIMECYKQASNELLEISRKYEEREDQVQLITLGIHMVDQRIFNAFSLPKLKNPIQIEDCSFDKLYTDAGSQVVLARDPSFTKQYDKVLQKYYFESRPKEKKWVKSAAISLEDSDAISTFIKINGIRLLLGKEKIPVEDIEEVVYHKDWYYLLTKTGEVITDIFSFDSRAHQEYEEYIHTKQKERVLKK